MKLFECSFSVCFRVKKKAQVQNFSDDEYQPYYEEPYQYTDGRNDTQIDICQQAEQMRREKGKLTEEINELKAQIDQKEGAYEEMRKEIDKLTEENNRFKNNIRQQAEQMEGEKGKLKEVNNRLKAQVNQGKGHCCTPDILKGPKEHL